MISQLSVKNFAIIKDLDITFDQGLNIITGETGAGKSIIIESINLALGSRADTTFVRTGCKKAVIQLILSNENSDDSVILTREVYAEGRSTCRINDEIVTLARLNSFCKKYVDVHGQYDNQALLNPENHLRVLDSFDVNGIRECTELYHKAYSEYAELSARLASLKKVISEATRKKDFMTFELKEISSADPHTGEDDELKDELMLLENGEKIFSATDSAYQSLYSQEGSCTELMMSALSQLKNIMELSPQLTELHNTIEECYYKIEDASSALSEYKNSIDFSPERIDMLIERQELLEGLKRKYAGSIDDILAYKSTLINQLSDMENSDYLEKELKEKISKQYKLLSLHAEKLSELRKAAALIMETSVNRELSELNFKNTVFKVDFKTLTGASGKYSFTPDGIDNAEFLISPNKGEALKPLAKIASGGEISRIMLAFKRIIGDFDSVPTFIFDEIDSGISGNAAGVVGQKLFQISKTHQIICITHLPQIAAMGDHHYLIEKQSNGEETFTTVNEMDAETLIKEIARLSGSWELTGSAVENAREMLETARNLKKSRS